MGFDALLVVLFSLLLGWWLGQLLWRLLRLPRTSAAEGALFATGLGLGLISYLTLAAGALGLLNPVGSRIFLVVGVVGAAIQLARPRSHPSWREGGSSPKADPSAEGNGGRREWFGLLPGLALGLTVLVCLLAALGPETEFDALNHHLGTARLYIEAGGIVATPNMAWASHPLTVEMLFIFGWVVHSQLAAKLFHFAFALLTAAGCLLFARKYLGTVAGLLAAFLFLASPLVTYLSQSAYIDLGLTFFAWLALWTFYNWQRSGERGWLVLSGSFTGLSLGSKYLGGVVLLVTGLLWAKEMWSRRKGTWRIPGRDFLAYFGVAAAVFSPWLLKNLVLTGNPVAPFLSDLIPTADLSSADYRYLVQLSGTWRGYQGGILDYLRSPWLLTFRPDLFHGSPGWAYLFLFPVGLVLGWRRPALRFLGLAVLTGFVVLLSATRNARYFVPLFPWISLVIAGGIWSSFPEGGWRLRVLRPTLATVAVALAFLQLPWFAGLWAVPHPLSLSPEKIRLFRTEDQRRSFSEAQVLGAGGWELYEFLGSLPASTAVLALTPVYQGLTGAKIFMPPNSLACNRLSSAAVNLAQNNTALDTLKMRFGGGRAARYWKVQVTSPAPLTQDELHPRFHHEENGIPLEVPAFQVRTFTHGSQIDIVADLGATRKLDTVSLLVTRGQVRSYRTWCSKERDGGWGEVEASTQIIEPEASNLDDFLRLCGEYGISYLVLGHHEGALFLPDYFLSTPPGVRHVKTIGGYEVFQISRR